MGILTSIRYERARTHGSRESERERVRVSHRPSVGIEELDPAIKGSSVKICAKAATVGVAVETGGGKGSGASRRWQCLPLDRTRVRQWGCGGGSEPRVKSCLPHLLFIGTVRRGPTSH